MLRKTYFLVLLPLLLLLRHLSQDISSRKRASILGYQQPLHLLILKVSYLYDLLLHFILHRFHYLIIIIITISVIFIIIVIMTTIVITISIIYIAISTLLILIISHITIQTLIIIIIIIIIFIIIFPTMFAFLRQGQVGSLGRPLLSHRPVELKD